jgi:hypothetical protein
MAFGKRWELDKYLVRLLPSVLATNHLPLDHISFGDALSEADPRFQDAAA